MKMQPAEQIIKDDALLWILAGVGMAILYALSIKWYLVFHISVELVSIAVAWGIFILGWNTRKNGETDSYLVLGTGYLFVGLIDLLHTFTYEGMNLIPGVGAAQATQLWIAARWLEAISLGAYLCNRRRKTSEIRVLLFFLTLFLAFSGSILVVPIFPVCYIPGQGLTAFKKINEYAIIALLAGEAAFAWRRNRNPFPPSHSMDYLTLSIAITMLSEFMFTLYAHPYSPNNAVGHILKFVSFLVLYKAIIIEGLSHPLEMLFSHLDRRDKILAAVASMAQGLLQSSSPKGTLRAALEKLGRATSTQRVYLFENSMNADGGICASLRCEWSDPSVAAFESDPDYQNVPYLQAGFSRWLELFPNGVPVWGAVKAFPEGERLFLQAQGIVSVAVLPVFIKDSWWGFIGLDDCRHEKTWDKVELEALKAAGTLTAAYIEKSKIENEIEAQRMKYKSLFELSMDAAAVFDDEWRLTAVNKRGCELSGYTQEELLGTLVFFHLIPDTSAEVHRLLQNRIPSSGLQFETYIRRKDGTGILSEIHIEALGGTQKGYQAIIRDISSRRRLEKSLLESTERERNKLGRELHDGLCQVLKSLEIDATLLKTEDHSKDNLIRRINEALRETYNYSKGLLPKELSIDDWELEFLRLGRLCRKDGSIQWNCRIDKNAIPRDSSVAHNLFRIAREAVINAERHSGTGRIDVALSMDAHGCFLAVKDYGLGIDPSLPPKEDSGLGMLAMKSRAEAIGAFITINPAPERGTEIICRSKAKHWGRDAE